MVKLEQIAQAKRERERKYIIPTRIVMNPVDAFGLYQDIRMKLMDEIQSEWLRAELTTLYPPIPSTLEGWKFLGLTVCYAVHYQIGYFEVCD